MEPSFRYPTRSRYTWRAEAAKAGRWTLQIAWEVCIAITIVAGILGLYTVYSIM